MKKYLFAFVVIATLASSLVGCKPKLKDMKGVVTYIDSDRLGDFIKSMKLTNGEDSFVFTMDKVQFDNGIALVGDSVDVSYIEGRGDTLRALLVHVKPTPAKVINLETDTTKTLLTR